MSQLDKLNNSYNESLYNLIVNTDHKWTQSWANLGFEQQNSKNNAYRGANQIVLFSRAVMSEFKDPRWVTFNEAKKNNTPIKKGSKGEFIGFFTDTASVLKKNDKGNPVLDKEGKKQYELVKLDRPVLKTYYVFNAQDVEGIKQFELPEKPKISDPEKYSQIDKMIESYCKDNEISLKEISSQDAFFSNGSKNVVMPLKEQFSNIDEYYAVAFHELTHSTIECVGRTNKKTDRKGYNEFGSKNYAKEELVAELGALFMCQKFGLSGFANNEESNTLKSLAYLKNWLKAGKLEKEDLSVALRDANKAVSKITSYIEKEVTKTVDEQLTNKTYSIEFKFDRKESKYNISINGESAESVINKDKYALSVLQNHPDIKKHNVPISELQTGIINRTESMKGNRPQDIKLDATGKEVKNKKGKDQIEL